MEEENASSSSSDNSEGLSSVRTVPMASVSTAAAAVADSTYVRDDSANSDHPEDEPLVGGGGGGGKGGGGGGGGGKSGGGRDDDKRRRRGRNYFHHHHRRHHDEDDDPIAVVHRTSARHLFPSPRPLLLGLSLGLTLATFWLLDSVKDPIFARLVGGDLSHHQPRAKIVSVVGTLCLVVGVEIYSNWRSERRRRRADAAAAGGGRDSDDSEVLDGGGSWTKMAIGDSSSSNPYREDYDDGGGSSSSAGGSGGGGGGSGMGIPISVFRAIGVPYLAAFAVVGFILSRHPERFAEQSSASSASAAVTDPTLPPPPQWRYLGYVLYLLIESFGSLSVAAFWAYANSTLTVTAAERWYGTIVALAQMGAIGGSTVAATRERGGVADVAPLFWLACLGIVLQVLVMALYGRLFPRPMSSDDDDDAAAAAAAEDGTETDSASAFDHMAAPSLPERDFSSGSSSPGCIGGEDKAPPHPALSGLYLIFRHKYVLLILGVSCLYEISLTCLDYEMKLIGLDRFGDESIMERGGGDGRSQEQDRNSGFQSMIASTFAQFMGRYGQLTNFLSLVLSYFAFPYLMKTRGLRSTLRIFPTLLVFITILTFFALPTNLPVLFVSMSLLKAMTYSVNDPAKEILYIPTSDAIKFRAKFWIDVVGERIAKGVGSSINTFAGSVERIVLFGTVPSLLTALGLWAVCYRVGIEFDRLLARGEIVGAKQHEGYTVIREERKGIANEDDKVAGGADRGPLFQDDDKDAGRGECGDGSEIELVSR